MEHPKIQLAILFADVNGSTALYERLGDQAARSIILRCMEIMFRVVNARQGRVIKTIGDEVMCTFPTAEAAFHASCEMQRAFESERPGGNVPLHMHIGFHYGEALQENNDIFGDAVNVAARIASMTRTREILTTRATFELLPDELRNQTREVIRAGLKGKDAEMGLFRIIWEFDDTLTRVGNPSGRGVDTTRSSMVLRYQGNSYMLDETNRSATLGREEGCTILIRGGFASRQHARVEYRYGKFTLIDRSSNGTIVRFEDGHVVHLQSEEIILYGTGDIVIGTDADQEVIAFAISS